MRYLCAVAIAIVLMLVVFSRAPATFVLDPERDMKVVQRKVINEDGTTSLKEEVIITKSGPDVTLPEEATLSSKTEKVTHARGWERKMGTFEPREPMFTVLKTRPKDWPIPETTEKAKDVPAAAEDERMGVHWILSLVCLGVIAFALFKLVMYVREIPDPNKA